ncbi:hypothetical protein ACFUN5_13310 [Streptomyces sp. NPDC057305]|uniref:hypothetical protein n=1 Tax=unclassified Streptomyces TaxID=2593676 RepID=UPI00362C7590
MVLRNDDNSLAALTCHHVAGDTGSRVFQPTAPPMPIGSTPDLTDSLGHVITFDSPMTQAIPTPVRGESSGWAGRSTPPSSLWTRPLNTAGRFPT